MIQYNTSIYIYTWFQKSVAKHILIKYCLVSKNTMRKNRCFASHKSWESRKVRLERASWRPSCSKTTEVAIWFVASFAAQLKLQLFDLRKSQPTADRDRSGKETSFCPCKLFVALVALLFLVLFFRYLAVIHLPPWGTQGVDSCREPKAPNPQLLRGQSWSHRSARWQKKRFQWQGNVQSCILLWSLSSMFTLIIPDSTHFCRILALTKTNAFLR